MEIKRLRVADVEIDMLSGTVWLDGRVLDLPDLSLRLLLTLVERAPAVVSKDDLISRVWGDVVVSDETLMQRVRLLRQALGDDAQQSRYIVAVRGRGYRLAAPVEPAIAGGSRPRTRLWLGAAAAAVAALIGLGWLLQAGRLPSAPDARTTLAVLPFADLSERQSYGYFADGMQEELLSRLTGLEELSVVSRTSAERFRGSTEPIAEIARQLGADGVVEGSVRVSGDQLRITVQLIDAATDSHVWARTFDGELTVERIFSIQETVANRIAESLQVEFERRRAGPATLPTDDIDAYDAYLLGLYHTYRLTADSFERAIEFLGDAIERDPAFAEAHTALGRAYSFLGTSYGRRDPTEVFPMARESALLALELDPDLGDAHSLYADILTWYDWEFELAESEYRRAMALQPANVLGYALLLSVLQRHDEAIELSERRLDITPDDDYVRTNLGWRYLHAGRFEDAMATARAASEHPDAATLLGYGLLATGEFDPAVEVFEEDLRRNGRRQRQLGNLAYAYYRVGRSAEARSLLAELREMRQTQHVSPLTFAAVHFAAGEEDAGYALLEEAVSERARSVIFLAVNPLFAGQRGDRRFARILDRVGLPS